MRNTPFNSLKVYSNGSFKPLYPDNDFRKYKMDEKFEDGSYIEEDGIINDGLVTKRTHKQVYDRTLFIKVFNSGIEIIAKLSNQGIKFYRFILSELIKKHECGYVVLPVKSTLVNCGYQAVSRTIYYDTITELINLDVLRKKECPTRDHYWVNPNMFFNGDRIKLFNDFDEYFKQKYGE